MTSDLVTALERTAALLKTLPRDLPEPLVRQFAGALALDFVKTRSNFVTVSVRASGHLYWISENSTTTDHGWAPFDGSTVPPEILKAIRRVAL